MKVYHGSKEKYDELRLGGGNNELGSGLYFIRDIKVAKHYGSNITSINIEDFKIVPFWSEIPQQLVNTLLKNIPEKDWYLDWAETPREAMIMFKNNLTGEFGEDIQTIWYDLYRYDQELFCKIVSKFVDGMEVNQEGGWTGMYVMYNILKVNKNSEHEVIEDKKFNEKFNQYMEEYRMVRIYRALLGGETVIRKGDYVTKSVKFAVEHAENNHIYEEEQHDVVTALVKSTDIENASNPGEYLSKVDVEGNVIYQSQGYEYDGWDSVKNDPVIKKYRLSPRST